MHPFDIEKIILMLKWFVIICIIMFAIRLGASVRHFLY